MTKDLNDVGFWNLDQETFLILLSATEMNSLWYGTFESYLISSKTKRNISVECLTWFLEHSLDLDTHLLIARYYPGIVNTAYNWMSVTQRYKIFQPERQEIMSTVSDFIQITK